MLNPLGQPGYDTESLSITFIAIDVPTFLLANVPEDLLCDVAKGRMPEVVGECSGFRCLRRQTISRCDPIAKISEKSLTQALRNLRDLQGVRQAIVEQKGLISRDDLSYATQASER